MTTKEFLTENKQEVISFYNEKINGFYSVSLKDFMTDLMVKFKKVTIGEDLKKYDLFANLSDAKSRLGLFTCIVEVVYTKPYSESNHAKQVAYFGAETIKLARK